jgi:hypothetical protein
MPGIIWRRQIARSFQEQLSRLTSMPDTQRRIRAFVVAELPRVGMPLTPAHIAEQLDMDLALVTASIAKLEAGLTYLFRDHTGAVEWAYPVTAATTPHRLTFSSGEEIWAA